jgi:hypothetical protein
MTNLLWTVFSQVSIPEGDLQIPNPSVPASVENLELLDIVFGVIAVVTVLIIVVAGTQFILSRGDPQKTATARNTIIYAAIGLTVAFLAFTIVRFVLGSL